MKVIAQQKYYVQYDGESTDHHIFNTFYKK